MGNTNESDLDEYIEISKKQGREFKSREEAQSALDNLVSYFEILIEMDMEEQRRKDRLKDEPDGYSMDGGGRTCSLCGRSIYDAGWYDKRGFICLRCKDGIRTRRSRK